MPRKAKRAKEEERSFGEEFYNKSAEAVIAELGSRADGLTDAEAAARLERYGPNEIIERKGRSAWRMLLAQFRSMLILMLLAATAVAALLGELIDAVVIFAIVVLNSLLGFRQEWKAERALAALKRLAAPKAEVVRNGRAEIIPVSEIVPGDMILLKVGDRVPADCRIIGQINLKTDEAILTGESTPVAKSERPLKGELHVADRSNMAFAGTTVVYGHGRAIVTATGMQTEFGRIASALQAPEEPTPLQRKLDALGKQLGALVIVAAFLIFGAGFGVGVRPLEMFLTAVALAVAAVPEALPAVATITLAGGVLSMAKHNALVRRLGSVETLGSTTVICSDKTGTMTANEMTVRKLYVNGRLIDVSGEGYSLDGKFTEDGKPVDPKLNEDLRLLVAAGMMCNDAVTDGVPVGDPTEIALLVAARKAGIEDLRKKFPRVDEVPFDSQRKMMSVVCQVGRKRMVYTKGAVESVLERCTHILRDGKIHRLTDVDRRRILNVNAYFAKHALRVLGFAVKSMRKGSRDIESGLVFVGLQGMIDPPRPEVKDAIERCKRAGIHVVMITGDHRDTALAVAKELGLIAPDHEADEVMTGAELDALTDEEFAGRVGRVKVYARVAPEHKVRITDAWKARGEIVAVTGDGVNDAPALKRADIGVAMGMTGTDVTREAADMVLMDDNFATIVRAVEEGRMIYDNIGKSIRYLLSCNLGEVFAVFIAMMAAFIWFREALLILLPAQILWMNIATDALPALALGVERAEGGVMDRRPRDPQERILNRYTLAWMGVVGALMMIGTVGAFFWALGYAELAVAQTLAFTLLVLFQKAVALSSRSEQFIHKVGFLTNRYMIGAIAVTVAMQAAIVMLPPFNAIFKTVPLGLDLWALAIGLTVLMFVLLEATKLAFRRATATRMRVAVHGWEDEVNIELKRGDEAVLAPAVEAPNGTVVEQPVAEDKADSV
ncbi:MAG: cation-translocating P-type ATPase [Candidatus Aenigmatarchaeota archaeon]